MLKRAYAILPFLILFVPVLTMGAAGGIIGTVEYRGEKVSGAYVEVFDASQTEEKSVSSANTDSRGQFSITLPSGRYRVTVKKRPDGPGSGGMLYGSTGKEALTVGRDLLTIPPIGLKDMGAGDGRSGEINVTGEVQGPDGPLTGAYVYFYPDGNRRGPGYIARVRTGEGGRFQAGVGSGEYTVTARFDTATDRTGVGGMGTVGASDLIGNYRSNPLNIGDEDVDLGIIELRPVDPQTWEHKKWAGRQGRFNVSGLVIMEDRTPLAGAYVFIYDDRRMVGKPVAISSPTLSDGHFDVAVTKPGTYYIGARTRYGGPVEPGEYMGAWDEKGPRPLVLEGKNPSAQCEIVVREVW